VATDNLGNQYGGRKRDDPPVRRSLRSCPVPTRTWILASLALGTATTIGIVAVVTIISDYVLVKH
jgi:hypothetical protein